MSARVTVHFTPPAAPLAADTTAVVIDVLRATTTLTVALAAGATGVHPVPSPELALATKRGLPDALLCGERGGVRIPGFDLGNSPAEYTAETVGGRELIFASTNGSLALLAARKARRCLIAAFVNVSAVVRELKSASSVTIVCAGTERRFGLEDAACAGWIAAALERAGAVLEGGPAALARDLAPRDASQVASLVQGSSHGRTLRALGPAYADDVGFCSRLDTLDRAFEWRSRPR